VQHEQERVARAEAVAKKILAEVEGKAMSSLGRLKRLVSKAVEMQQ
jgi:hypothetical protein